MSLRDEIARAASVLGVSPTDLAAAISYETGGTFDPAQKGPTTKWGQHEGLIQMGEPQRKQYGYDVNGPLSGQMDAVINYLKDNGVKPGMGLLDIYSTINAGAPGLYNRSDEAAGGAPGTVRDKVEKQMFGHLANAFNMFGMAPGAAPAMAAPEMGAVTSAPLPTIPGTELAAGPQQMPMGMSLNSTPGLGGNFSDKVGGGLQDAFSQGGFMQGMKAMMGDKGAVGGLQNMLGGMGGAMGGGGGGQAAAPTITPANVQSNASAIAPAAQQLLAQIMQSRGVPGLRINGRRG